MAGHTRDSKAILSPQALLAGNVCLTARSFKYHRPRGIISAGSEEPGTLVELLGKHSSGNRSITTVRLEDGLEAKSVNCWPSPGFDLGGINQLLSGFLPAGFYYKTFMWPNWRLYEPFIRWAAGLAEAPALSLAEGKYESRHEHVDVLVVGAGPAGLSAALHAGRSGARVMLVDENSEAGGSLLGRSQQINGDPAVGWARAAAEELAAMSNARHLQNANAWGIREHNLALISGESAWGAGRIAEELARAGLPNRRSDRSDRANIGVCQQRPTWSYAVFRSAGLRKSLRGGSRQQSCSLYEQ